MAHLQRRIRLTRFSGALAETSADPRVGAAIRLPKLNWVLRGYYGRYYQAPPLDTVSGPLLQFAAAQASEERVRNPRRVASQ